MRISIAHLFLLQQEVLRVVDVVIDRILHPEPPGLSHWAMHLREQREARALEPLDHFYFKGQFYMLT